MMILSSINLLPMFTPIYIQSIFNNPVLKKFFVVKSLSLLWKSRTSGGLQIPKLRYQIRIFFLETKSNFPSRLIWINHSFHISYFHFLMSLMKRKHMIHHSMNEQPNMQIHMRYCFEKSIA